MTNFQKVKIFMETFGQEVKTQPSFSSEKINNLRYNLIKEELDELKKAMDNKDLLEVADALTDILYVTYGAGIAFGIDFKKGCYVGQENTARIKHKNKLSKRILPITVLEGKLDDDIIKINNNEIGKVLIKNNRPFALIKLKEKDFEFNKEINCSNAKILFKKPQWL